MKILFVWPNKDAFGYKPIAISLFSAMAKSRGWEVELLDTTEIDFGFIDNTRHGQSAKLFKPVDLTKYDHVKRPVDLKQRFTNLLRAFSPDCIACTVLNDERTIASEICRIAKEWNPDVPVIWGNKYPTLEPEQTLREHAVDFVCIGEGIDAFDEFLTAMEGKRDPFSIPNIWAKKDSTIVKNPLRSIRKTIDDLPYLDWDIFDKRQFYKPFDGKVYVSGDHMLNWGCPYSCTYCINHVHHRLYDNKYYVKRYSVERIVDELKFLKQRHGLQFMKFHDEDFLMRPTDNLRELGRAYREAVNLPFVIETNPKTVTCEKVKILKEMNCVSVSMAIETGDTHLRRNVLKRVDSERDIFRAFKLFKDAGIRTSCFLMLGIPFETRETYNKTIEIVRKADVQYPNIFFFYPFEGTMLRQIAIENRFFNPTDEAKRIYRRDVPALTFRSLTQEELIEMRNVFVLYAKLPFEYHAYIKRSEIMDETGKELREELIDIYEKTVWANDGWYKDDGYHEKYSVELENIMLPKVLV